MPSDEQDLRIIRQAEQKRAAAANVTVQVFNEMKSSLLCQINWEELLQSAPTAISSMGACFIASSSPKALVVLKEKPDKPFEHLRYSSVQANLVECANLGRFAFLEAEKGMGTIQLTSQIINRKINDIIQCLGDPASAKRMLKPQLNAIEVAAEQCLECATAIDVKFEKWLKYAYEMHAACVEEENDTEMQLLQNLSSLAVAKEQLKTQERSAEAAQKAQDLMEKQINLASDAFKNASDKFPSGWNLIAQSIVQDFASTSRGALNQMVSNCNPANWSRAGRGRDYANGSRFSRWMDSVTSPMDRHMRREMELQDPAYSSIQLFFSYLTGLHVIINGSDGIDWEKARGDGTIEGAGGNITFLADMLQDSEQKFRGIATTGKASVDFTHILQTSVKIAFEINDVVKNSSYMSASYPANKSEKVKRWKRDFEAAYWRAKVIAATGNSIPGTPATNPPIAGSYNASQTAPIGSMQAQTTLAAAKDRLAMTQELMTTTQANYTKTTDMLLQQQQKLGEIQANLTRLSDSNVSLEEIKRILVECIQLIVHLKSQIENLVRFFQSISSTLKVVVKLHVNPFIETIKTSVAIEGTDPSKYLVIGNYTLADYQRTTLYDATVTLRAYFGVFGDIARMWVKLSQANIFPGLKLCDELSVMTQDPRLMRSKVAQLTAWSQDASSRIKQIAREKQQEILSGMDARIEEVAETTRMITPFSQETVTAISAGAQVATTIVQVGIESRASTSFQFTGIPDDD